MAIGTARCRSSPLRRTPDVGLTVDVDEEIAGPPPRTPAWPLPGHAHARAVRRPGRNPHAQRSPTRGSTPWPWQARNAVAAAARSRRSAGSSREHHVAADRSDHARPSHDTHRVSTVRGSRSRRTLGTRPAASASPAAARPATPLRNVSVAASMKVGAALAPVGRLRARASRQHLFEQTRRRWSRARRRRGSKNRIPRSRTTVVIRREPRRLAGRRRSGAADPDRSTSRRRRGSAGSAPPPRGRPG